MIIEIKAGKNDPKQISVEHDVCFIGSDSSCQVVIKHSTISGKHLKVEQEGHKLFVTDISDANTVVINNYKLDHNKKTQYLGHYPVILSPNISVSIKASEVSLTTETEDDQNVKSSLAVYEKTNSKIRKNPLIEKSESEKKKNPEKSNLKNVVILSLFLAAGGWYYWDQSEEVEETPPEQILALKKNNKKVSLPKADLRELFKSSLCESSEEKTLCSAIFSQLEPNEGVKMTDEGVFIFFKLDQHLNSNNQIKLFETYSEDKKLKYTLGSLILKDPILKTISQNLTIHAVGFDTFSDIPILRAYLKIERSPDFQFSEEDLRVIHSYSINAGMPKFFDDYLSSFVSFSRVK
jgi:hypothetical protein